MLKFNMIDIAGHRLANSTIISFCAFIIICSILTSCCNNKNEAEYMQYVSIDKVDSILGKENEKILSIFSEAANNEMTSNTEEVALLKEWYFKDIPVKITLIFENNSLFRIKYDFGSQNEAALDFANEVCLLFSQKYGNSDTYPTLSERIEGLSFERYKTDTCFQYKEYWIDKVNFFDSVLPEKYKDVKRIDLGITLEKRTQGNDFQTVVYVGGIVNNITTKHISN